MKFATNLEGSGTRATIPAEMRKVPSMSLQKVELPDEVIERAKALTGKRTARAALTALTAAAGRSAARLARAHRGKVEPNGDVLFASGKDAARFMREFLK